MRRLRDERRITILYITHDLASARFLADRVIVMLRGAPVEGGPSGEVMDEPVHPYTRLLVSAAPDPRRRTMFDEDERRQTRALIADGVRRRRDAPRGASDPSGRQSVRDTHWVDLTGFAAGAAK